jgi:formylglycine-generating enzyme required for sulfatase activity
MNKFRYLLALLLVAGCAGAAVKNALPVGENPPEGVDAALWRTVDTLVAKLGDDDFHVREAAQKEIEGLPGTALEAVRVAVERRSSDWEIKRRGKKAIAGLTDKAFWEKAPKEMTNSIGMKLVLIPAGEFLMGSPDTDKDFEAGEGPQHRVIITMPFYIGTTEVTQAQWKAVMGNNPSNFQGDDLPVEKVSFDNCNKFLTKLSVKEGKSYRLPTEAEWEYACRAGSTTRFNSGDDDSALDGAGWYAGNSDRKTHLVGQKKPNAWGLYDMHGNVCEWCQDWYEQDYYRSSQAVNPTGPAQPQRTYRVFRGGSWEGNSDCRSAARCFWGVQVDCSYYIGFRVVLVSGSMTSP